jgi:hypothetical protein
LTCFDKLMDLQRELRMTGPGGRSDRRGLVAAAADTSRNQFPHLELVRSVGR